jgi:hypothetical protein
MKFSGKTDPTLRPEIKKHIKASLALELDLNEEYLSLLKLKQEKPLSLTNTKSSNRLTLIRKKVKVR